MFHWYVNYIKNGCTWVCLNMPGWYSSNQSTCQTNREPSVGWMLNNMSAPLFHSSNSTSTWCFTRGRSATSGPWLSFGLLLLSSSSKLSSSSGSEEKSNYSALKKMKTSIDTWYDAISPSLIFSVLPVLLQIHVQLSVNNISVCSKVFLYLH